MATEPASEGRELMGWTHDLSAARGHVLQVTIGIPYFYRLFGYTYAIHIAAHRPLATPPAQDALEDHAVRPANTADLPEVRRLCASMISRVAAKAPRSSRRQTTSLESCSFPSRQSPNYLQSRLPLTPRP